MAEQSGDIPKPQQVIESRMKEELAKSKLLMQRWKSSRDLLEGVGAEKAQDVVNILKDIGRFEANVQWVESLFQVGIPLDTILKAWDIKDQLNRDLKDDKNPQ